MYDSDQGTVVAALQGSSAAIFTSDTINRILSLTTTRTDTTVRIDSAAPDVNGNVTVAAGTEVVLVTSSDVTQTAIKPPANAPVIIFEGKGGVAATINDGANAPAHAPGVVDRVVVGSSGNDKIVVSDAKNTQIVLGTGHSTVVTGAGNDTVVAGLGNSTVSSGGGHDIVQIKGVASNYTVTVANGHAVVTDNTTHATTDISKIQYVQLDGGKALVFANDSTQAAVTTLYETTFGRTADANGLQYWFDLAAKGASLADIAKGFMQSSEYQGAPAQNNADFVNNLYEHTFGRAADSAGLAYWTAALQAGGASRAQLIASFSDIAAHNIDGTAHTEATVVGSVTIVHNII